VPTGLRYEAQVAALAARLAAGGGGPARVHGDAQASVRRSTARSSRCPTSCARATSSRC
jgi:hypothetical protein